jgi:O-acetyl-ADP-ribose deacetylase (regulator of RNase III)
MSLLLYSGNILDVNVDAIVNAANSSLLGGGGIDGAIHRAAGNELYEYCEGFEADIYGRRCQVGEAVVTPAFNLKNCDAIIHTVGPRYDEPELYHCPNSLSEEPVYRPDSIEMKRKDLKNCYYNSIVLAAKNGFESIAFPCISTGIYRFPNLEAAEIAVETVNETVTELYPDMKVVFVTFLEKDKEIYKRLLSFAN